MRIQTPQCGKSIHTSTTDLKWMGHAVKNHLHTICKHPFARCLNPLFLFTICNIPNPRKSLNSSSLLNWYRFHILFWSGSTCAYIRVHPLSRQLHSLLNTPCHAKVFILTPNDIQIQGSALDSKTAQLDSQSSRARPFIKHFHRGPCSRHGTVQTLSFHRHHFCKRWR